jgi:hypothetical protein
MQNQGNIRSVGVFVSCFGQRRRFARRSGSSIALQPQGSVLFDLLRFDVIQLRTQPITSVSVYIQKPFQQLAFSGTEFSEFGIRLGSP